MPKSSRGLKVRRTNSAKIGEANYKTAVFQEDFGTKKFAYMQELDRIDFIRGEGLIPRRGIKPETNSPGERKYPAALRRGIFIITDNADRHLIWAETKRNHADIVEMFVQLILTIGKARTFDRINPPPFLCVFDYEKIAFLHYHELNGIFYQNDFNWNITIVFCNNYIS